MFSYETHFGEVSGMFSKCSKLNLVSHVKSTNVQKKLFFSFRNYVQLRLCQSWLSNMSGIFSKLCLDNVEGSSGRKTGLLLFLMQCELIGCEFKVSYKYLKTILLLTNHLEYLEEKE